MNGDTILTNTSRKSSIGSFSNVSLANNKEGDILEGMARILPVGLILKTTQNYKPLWVPNPNIPMEFRDKPNPYLWIFSGRVG